MKIDIKKPLEAVKKSTGEIVPMEFEKMQPTVSGKAFSTESSPCPATSNSLWRLDGTDWCYQDAWTIRNVKEETVPAIDTSKPLQTRSGSKVVLEGTLTDGRLVVVISHGPFGTIETKVVPADGRMLRQPAGTTEVLSQSDIINVPSKTVVEFFNIYDDSTISLNSKNAYQTAVYASRYGKVRVGILEVHTVDGGRTFSKVHPTEPQLRTPANPDGINPYA